MKKFVSENWYKLMIGSSLLMASFGFMVHSVSPAMADGNNQKLNVNSNYKLVPTNADGSINVKLSDEQLDKIIPKNTDGSVKITLNKEQITELRTPMNGTAQEVVLTYYDDKAKKYYFLADGGGTIDVRLRN